MSTDTDTSTETDAGSESDDDAAAADAASVDDGDDGNGDGDGDAIEAVAEEFAAVTVDVPASAPDPEVEVPGGEAAVRSAPEEPQAPLAPPVDLALAATTKRHAGPDAAAASAQQYTSVSVDNALSNQVSPLGTPEQIAREQIAMQTAKSLPVAFMKLILRLGFLSAANKQFALVGGPDAANREALTRAIDEYALAAAFQQQILNPMDPAVVTQVAPPHSWYGLDVGGSRLLYDNPDTIYRFMPVNKTSEYVITGRLYDGIPADITFSVLEGTAGTTSTILSLSDLEVDEDGTFVITVSGESAAPGQTNHLQLTSRSTLIAARDTLGDWTIEDPMGLAVHRVSGPRNSLFAQLGGFVLLGGLVNDSPLLTSLVSVIPPLGIAESRPVRGMLTALLLLVRGANEQAKYMALATTDPDTGELRAPNVLTQPASNAEFLANQLQSNGYFQLADDEALVLTIDPGNAGFFTAPVYNDWTITDDYWNQQTSLNNDQAVANLDGTYTLVVSVADPAVANWISTGGLNQGIISMRFQDLDPESSDTPGVQSVVVKLEDLDEHLPAGTVYVTAAERAAQLATRKAGFDKRWAPYPQL
ncbi:hypothetical protein [Mycolicibacterium vanbaalenii]|uniref:hypothetical protein n=1 Tax=Mycolicibacterium vanbaalenii TaxID=110539 RepID=UPI001F46B2BF|nr:hypothetical protein [Mycolicibacterium vanbaalenii]